MLAWQTVRLLTAHHSLLPVSVRTASLAEGGTLETIIRIVEKLNPGDFILKIMIIMISMG